jgi:hypothetical protein
MNIALVSKGTHGGFVHLSDNEGNAEGHGSEQRITVRTDIQQDWDKI